MTVLTNADYTKLLLQGHNSLDVSRIELMVLAKVSEERDAYAQAADAMAAAHKVERDALRKENKILWTEREEPHRKVELYLSECNRLEKERDALAAELEACRADAARLAHLVSTVHCSILNIDGNHSWNFMFNKGWETGATFREAIDNAIAQGEKT